MLRTNITFAALALTMMAACTHAPAAPGSCPTADRSITEVADTMRQMYAALKADDLQGFRAVTTSDFFAFDAGKRFDAEALVNLVKAAHDRGAVYEWTVNDPTVEVACNTALVTYINTGSLTEAGAKRDLSWLESATMVHDGQRWRIRFFHSTRVP